MSDNQSFHAAAWQRLKKNKGAVFGLVVIALAVTVAIFAYFIAPMCQYSANESGELSFWHEQQWANYASSGAGLCIIEATAVQPEGRISYADLGLWNDQQGS